MFKDDFNKGRYYETLVANIIRANRPDLQVELLPEERNTKGDILINGKTYIEVKTWNCADFYVEEAQITKDFMYEHKGWIYHPYEIIIIVDPNCKLLYVIDAAKLRENYARYGRYTPGLEQSDWFTDFYLFNVNELLATGAVMRRVSYNSYNNLREVVSLGANARKVNEECRNLMKECGLI